MKQITEIIIHPTLNESAKVSIECVVDMVKENLGKFNILKVNLNAPVIMFDGHMSNDVVRKTAEFISEFGYNSSIITLTDDIIKVNGKPIEYED